MVVKSIERQTIRLLKLGIFDSRCTKPQEEIGVIILWRDVDKTAYSLLRVHDDAGRFWSGLELGFLSPNSPRNLSQPVDNANPYALANGM